MRFGVLLSGPFPGDYDPSEMYQQTYKQAQIATGISTVVVNGTVVIDGGQHTGSVPGKVLRRSAGGVG